MSPASPALWAGSLPLSHLWSPHQLYGREIASEIWSSPCFLGERAELTWQEKCCSGAFKAGRACSDGPASLKEAHSQFISIFQTCGASTRYSQVFCDGLFERFLVDPPARDWRHWSGWQFAICLLQLEKIISGVWWAATQNEMVSLRFLRTWEFNLFAYLCVIISIFAMTLALNMM